jgi:predicted lipid-binding transport protein (Tim44 family)
MIYFLAVLTFLIFYQFYKIVGRSDCVPQHMDAQNDDLDSYDPETMAKDKVHQKEIQGQWAMLKKIHSTLTPAAVMHDLLEIFEKAHHAFAKGIISDVKNFLSPSIVQQFQEDVKRRNGYVMHMSFLKKPECIIKQIAVDPDKNCTIDTEFQSEQLVYIEDKNGVIVDNPHKMSESIKNYWVFKKNLTNISAPWMLVEMV